MTHTSEAMKSGCRLHPGSGRIGPNAAATLEFRGISHSVGAAGGDLLEVVHLDHERTAYCVADVIGHGAAASRLGRQVRESLRAAARRDGDPAQVCRRLNRALCARFSHGQFVTAFYAILDRRTGQLRYSRAGHTPSLLLEAALAFSGGCLADDATVGVLAVDHAA